MSEWIKLYAGAFTHPKTRRLAKRLGVTAAAAVGHMACLWSFTAEFAPDGDLGKFDDEEVEVGAGWEGVDGQFVSAALAVGYLEGTPGCLSVHDWSDYGGKLCDRKVSERERSAARRAKDKNTKVDRSTTVVRPQADRERDRERRERRAQVTEVPETEPEEEPHVAPSPRIQRTYRRDFERWWDASGGHGTKSDADLLYRYWIDEGASEDDLLTAVVRYSEHCASTGRRVMDGRTFLAKQDREGNEVNRWQEWAAGEPHGSMDVSGAGHLNDVLAAGGLTFGLNGGRRGNGLGDARRALGAAAGGTDAGRGVPAVELDSGE